MHGKKDPVVHRDLNAKNILSEDFNAKIIQCLQLPNLKFTITSEISTELNKTNFIS